MERQLAHSLITSYVDGWRTNIPQRVLDTLTPDCTIIESHGPTYHGRDHVQQWMTSWFAAGGSIQQWNITSLVFADDAAAFEWVFECTGSWGHASFEGATVVRFVGERIYSLREYRCTEVPYVWTPNELNINEH